MLTKIPIEMILAYLAGLIILYVIGWFLLVPLRGFVKIIVNSLIGGIVLYVLNLIEPMTQLHIALNPVNAFVTGLLGVPGLALLIALRLFIYPS